MNKDLYINYLLTQINNYDIKEISCKGFFFCLLVGFLALSVNLEGYLFITLVFGFFALLFIINVDFGYYHYKKIIKHHLNIILSEKCSEKKYYIDSDWELNSQSLQNITKSWFYSWSQFCFYFIMLVIFVCLGSIICIDKGDNTLIVFWVYVVAVFTFILYMLFTIIFIRKKIKRN